MNPPLPAERVEWQKNNGQRITTGKAVAIPEMPKSYLELTEAERKKLELELDLKIMRESEARRQFGLSLF